jgi:hypothetical protein
MAEKTVRTARLNRRRYLEITRLLKEVVGNEKAGLARRMKAAEMLLSVYDRHDKALDRKERSTLKEPTEIEPEPIEPVAEESGVSDTAHAAFLEAMRPRGRDAEA